MRLRPVVLVFVVAAGCAAAPSSEEVVRPLRPGMALHAIERTLAPILVARAYANAWGSGRQTLFYRLKGDRELVVNTGATPNDETAEHLSPLRPGKRWFGLFFDPSAEDRQRAVALAVKQVRDVLRAGSSPATIFPTDPGGMLVRGNSYKVDLELQPGKPEAVEISCGWASWRTHRLLSLDFLKAGSWLFEVTVDLDDGRVVPTRWSPTPDEAARARSVADAACRDVLSKEGRLQVTVSGEYDYGPLRRLVCVSYQMHQHNGTSLSGALVDLDAGKLFEWAR